jgi:hypothetical protein
MIRDPVCKECGWCCDGTLSGLPKCKHLSSTGCILAEDKRYPSCDLYPYILVKDMRFKNERRLFLDINCPYWKEFIKYQDQITDNDYKTLSLVIMDICIHPPVAVPQEPDDLP